MYKNEEAIQIFVTYHYFYISIELVEAFSKYFKILYDIFQAAKFPFKMNFFVTFLISTIKTDIL